MNNKIAELLKSTNTDVLSKFDPYLRLALLSAFSGYDIGGAAASKISIGFTVETNDVAFASKLRQEILKYFSIIADARLTEAHLSDLASSSYTYLTADVNLPQLFELAEFNYIREIQLCANLQANRSVPRQTRSKTNTSKSMEVFRSKKSKILALIDHGCPFANRAFLSNTLETEIFSIWDQDLEPDFPVDSGSIPNGYGYGRQINRDTLNGFIKAATSNQRIDENLCYEIAQYPAMRSEYTHGSCTLGLMASKWQSPSLSATGRSEPFSDALDADIVFVQLPRNVPIAPDRGSIERCTLDGIRYVLDATPDNAHAVVVVDYGTEMGSHDGVTWFERALDAMVRSARDRGITLDVIFPSGNSYAKKRRAIVFVEQLEKNTVAEIGWWLPVSNDVQVACEIWYKAESLFDLAVSLPNGEICIAALNSNKESTHCYPADNPYCFVVCKQHEKQWNILILINSTNEIFSTRPVPPAGVWKLTFRSLQNNIPPINMYTHWGGKNPSLPQRVVPTKFVLHNEFKEVAAITGDGSILGSGCGSEPYMVGGYEKWGSKERSKYSSGGKSRAGKRALKGGADCLLVTEQSTVLPGLLCIGNRFSSHVRVSGTSFAAPQLARLHITGLLPLANAASSKVSRSLVRKLKKRDDFGEPRIP